MMKVYEQTLTLRKSALYFILWYFCSICIIVRYLPQCLPQFGQYFEVTEVSGYICNRLKVAAKARATKYSVCDYYENEFIDTCSKVDFMPTIQNVRCEFQSTFYAFHTGAHCTSDDSKYVLRHIPQCL